MTAHDILVPAAIMAILRREQTVRGVAERFGVTEAQVEEWQSVFLVAGVLALTEFRQGRLTRSQKPVHAASEQYARTTHMVALEPCTPGPESTRMSDHWQTGVE